jgi:hypothetical protein
VREAIFQLVQQRIDDQSFGSSFPSICPDGTVNAGVNENALRAAMKGFRIIWPQDARARDDDETTDGQIFDLLEYTYEHISLPIPLPGSYHEYHRHHHYRYDQSAGRRQFVEQLNRLFERNGVAFQIRDGEIERLAPTILDEVLASSVFNTGDGILDELLTAAREKFLSRSLDIRREALEKLWDAWERLKSLSDHTDKKRSIGVLLDRGSRETQLRLRLEVEARQLTEIGNEFLIRHSEVGNVPITESIHVDYLFHRLFALMRMLLRANGVPV